MRKVFLKEAFDHIEQSRDLEIYTEHHAYKVSLNSQMSREIYQAKRHIG